MLVYHGQELVFEEYMNGHTQEKPHLLASGTKSFSGAMLVAAADDGLLTFDEPLSQTLDEWKDDARKSAITLRQLLSLTSGIKGGENGRVPGYKTALSAATVKFAPGKRFQYGPVPYQIFGEVMRRKLGGKEDPLQYMERRIFSKIGMKYDAWREDDEKMPHLPSGAMLRAREWAKFGLLIKQAGKWNGETLLSEARLKECFQGSKANPAYGLTFWLNPNGAGPRDLVMAAGKGKQKLYIIPSLDLLIVQFADAERRYEEKRFLSLAVGAA
jgi:CubicO group peptidase (beta-lactamase class C family)